MKVSLEIYHIEETNYNKIFKYNKKIIGIKILD